MQKSLLSHYSFLSVQLAGKPVPEVLNNPGQWGKGQRINYLGDNLTFQEYVDIFKRVTGHISSRGMCLDIALSVTQGPKS